MGRANSNDGVEDLTLGGSTMVQRHCSPMMVYEAMAAKNLLFDVQ